MQTAHLLAQPSPQGLPAGVPQPIPDAHSDEGGPAKGLAPNNFFENPFGDDESNVRRAHRVQPNPAKPRTGRYDTIQTSAQQDQLDLLYAAPQQESASDATSGLRDQPVNGLRSANELPAPAQGAFPAQSPDDASTEFGLPDSLRSDLGDPDLSQPESSLTPPPEAPFPQSSGNIRELMEQSQDPRSQPSIPDDAAADVETLPAPKVIDDPTTDTPSLLDQNPFDKDDDELEQLRRDLNLEASPEQPPSFNDRRPMADDDRREAPEGGISCEEFRARVRSQTIREVSLDPSPPFRPDVIDQQEYEELKSEFDERQSLRQWRSIDGTPLAIGSLRDLAYQKAVIETQQGGREELPLDQLSEADISYITENWGLPQECLIEQVVFQPRQWNQMTMTWKASNLCHKPLYFEEVNLERYGHTAGPLLQPIVSSAHFFANISVLPYKMGVHSPHECQYALGYYRPGNCAPWIIPPKPISARGAVYQAAAMSGLFWLIP